MNLAMNLDRTGLCCLRTSLTEGKTLNLLEMALLNTFITNEGEDEKDIFKTLKSRSKLGTLKDEPVIKDVINIIDHLLSNGSSVVQLNARTPRTMMFGSCIRAIIQGASGEDYVVDVVLDVKDTVTNEPEILKQQQKMQQQYPDMPVNGLQCLMDTNNVDLIHKVIEGTLASDKRKPRRNFASVQEFINSIDTDTGFIVKSDKYTVVVYSRGEEMVVKTTRSNDKNFIDTDATIFDLLFR